MSVRIESVTVSHTCDGAPVRVFGCLDMTSNHHEIRWKLDEFKMPRSAPRCPFCNEKLPYRCTAALVPLRAGEVPA